jgi:hypothetical protein
MNAAAVGSYATVDLLLERGSEEIVDAANEPGCETNPFFVLCWRCNEVNLVVGCVCGAELLHIAGVSSAANDSGCVGTSYLLLLMLL